MRARPSPNGTGGSRSQRRRGTGHELREVVLGAAADLLAHLGDVEALTMRAVAAGAGVTAPSVYRHFPDKDALVRAVIERRFRQFDEMLAAAGGGETAARPDDDRDGPSQLSRGERGGETAFPFARLRAMAHAYVDWGLQHTGHYRVLFSAINAGPVGLGLPAGSEHPGAASFRTLLNAVTACLDPPDDGNALALATQLWASLHGIVDLRITKPELPWPAPEDLVELSLSAIRVGG